MWNKAKNVPDVTYDDVLSQMSPNARTVGGSRGSLSRGCLYLGGRRWGDCLSGDCLSGDCESLGGLSLGGLSLARLSAVCVSLGGILRLFHTDHTDFFFTVSGGDSRGIVICVFMSFISYELHHSEPIQYTNPNITWCVRNMVNMYKFNAVHAGNPSLICNHSKTVCALPLCIKEMLLR